MLAQQCCVLLQAFARAFKVLLQVVKIKLTTALSVSLLYSELLAQNDLLFFPTQILLQFLHTFARRGKNELGHTVSSCGPEV